MCYVDGMSPDVKKGMKRLDIYLPEEDEQRFREEVFKRKGMKKGNISEATQEAILLWIGTETPKKKGK
jgi:hypothetical protein